MKLVLILSTLTSIRIPLASLTLKLDKMRNGRSDEVTWKNIRYVSEKDLDWVSKSWICHIQTVIKKLTGPHLPAGALVAQVLQDKT